MIQWSVIDRVAFFSVRGALALFLICAAAANVVGKEQAVSGDKNIWRESGFSDFVDGEFGGGGQNLYVSKNGVLQRIFQFDLNRDGWFDIVICNSQDHWEMPDCYVYENVFGERRRVPLASDGSRTGTVADLNADGFDDIILGMSHNGIRRDLNAFIYYGSPAGYSQRRHHRLPAPDCRAVAAADFNSDGRCDVAFLRGPGLRVFYQTPLGLEPRRHEDLTLPARQAAAGDLDQDGASDLVLRVAADEYRVLWGAPEGLDVERATTIPVPSEVDAAGQSEGDAARRYAEYVADAEPLVKIIWLQKKPHIFVPRHRSVLFIPVDGRESFGKPIELACPAALSAASGDVNGDGEQDVVLACRQPGAERERSWIYWGDAGSFTPSRRESLQSFRACDVAVGDLDGDGCDDVVLCQSFTPDSFSHESLVYRGSRDGIAKKPIKLPGEDARRVLLARRRDSSGLAVLLVNHMARGKLGNPDVSVYLGSADGFRPERRMALEGWGALESLGCDLNDDGLPDLVVANASENSVHLDPGSFLFMNRPSGLPRRPQIKLPTTRAHGACCADLDRDGYLDLVFCGFDNSKLTFFYGTRDGFKQEHSRQLPLEFDGVVYKEPRWIHLADLNADGWLDMVVPMILDDRSFILWGSSEGFSNTRYQALSVERAACARSADLDADGDLDLLLGGHNVSRGQPHDSFLYIYWNGPDGLVQADRTLLPAAGINGMSVADFNRDGQLDVYVGSYHAGTTRDTDSYIYWNRPGHGFRAQDRQRLFTHSASGCVAADFNRDGWTDLAVANHKVWGDHAGWSGVWWNSPEGFDPKKITKLPSLGPHGITSVGPGNQWDRGPEEYYISSPFRAPKGAVPRRIAWEADCPPHTWVNAQLRVASSRERLEKAPWLGPDGKESRFSNTQEVDGDTFGEGWIQYRLALGATDGLATPRVSEVRVEFRKR